MNTNNPVYILVETPVQRASRESANQILDFILSHLEYYPYVIGFAVGTLVTLWWLKRNKNPYGY